MDLTKLTQLKTNSLSESFDQLKDLNGIIGIMDNTAASLSSLLALAIPNQNLVESISVMDDVYGAYPNNTTNSTAFPSNLGYLFDLKQDYKLQLQSDITDHYTEENFVVHDHVANKPIILTLTGKFAELDYNNNYRDSRLRNERNMTREISGSLGTNKNALNMFDSVVNKAGSLTQFAPGLSNSLIALKNTAGKAYGLVNNVKNLAKTINARSGADNANTNLDVKSTKIDDLEGKQYQAVREYFYTWWKNKTPFMVLTPFGAFGNMYIQEFLATQDETTRYVTNVQITFKEIRIATTKVYKPTSSNRVALQKSKKESQEPTSNNVVLYNESVGSAAGKSVNSITGISSLSNDTVYNKSEISKVINSSAQAAATDEDVVKNASLYSLRISGTGTSAFNTGAAPQGEIN